MKLSLWMCRRRNKLYMLTLNEPELVELDGFPGVRDFQPRQGDPVFYNNMCTLITPKIFDGVGSMKPLSPPRRVWIDGGLLTEGETP